LFPCELKKFSSWKGNRETWGQADSFGWFIELGVKFRFVNVFGFVSMGIMGATTVVMNQGHAPKAASKSIGLTYCVDGTVDLNIQFTENGGVKSVDDKVEEVLSEWWGCREVMQRTESALGEDAGSPAPILRLPDDVMTLIFAQLPRQSLAMTRLVCSSWKRVAEQQELASLRRKVPQFLPTPALQEIFDAL
jgi:hypothetical protein